MVCCQVNATTTAAGMNVSSSGSDYIFIYRGNDPTTFDALIAYNPVGWTATCAVNSPCSGQTAIIDYWTQPAADYIYLYTKNSDGTTYMPTSGAYYSFTSPSTAQVLCCGGSASVFVPNSYNTTRLQTYNNRTINERNAQVYIEQIGSNNIIAVEQTGTRDNRAEYTGTGNNNTVSILQTGDATASNYTELGIVGNNNNVSILQQSTGGNKGAFIKVNDSNNTLLLTQKDSGSHYADVTLSGGNKNVDILQQGSAGHMASVGLTGNPTDLSLTQSGSAQHFYSIQFNCATVGGCPKITVQQGQ
jgi:hypothetical protein